MRRVLSLVLVSCAVLSGCNAGRSVAEGAGQFGRGFGAAATAPLEDLNLRQQMIPTVLLQAEANPYDLRNLNQCRPIAAEVRRLDDALGPDLDEPPSPDGRFIAAIDNAGRLQLWSAPQWQAHATLWLRREPGRSASDALGALGALRRLAWLPDSQRIAVATQSGAAVVITLPAVPATTARP